MDPHGWVLTPAHMFWCFRRRRHHGPCLIAARTNTGLMVMFLPGVSIGTSIRDVVADAWEEVTAAFE